MRVMVMVRATQSSEKGTLPSEKLLQEMGAYNEALVKAGIMKNGDGLKPSSEGVRIRFSGTKRTVTDGPFAETKELIAGFWEWEVSSMEEAIEWAKKCPNPMPEDSDLEIRPYFEMSDFEEVPNSEGWKDKEEALRNNIIMQKASIDPYIFYGGCCEEALEFYKKALGAEVQILMRFNESPEPTPEGMLPAGFENKVMHATFMVGSNRFMASDGCGDDAKPGGFRLSIQLDGAEEAERIFKGLAEGGKVDMPLGKTFWSPCFGMVTDPFGIGWMVNVVEEGQS